MDLYLIKRCSSLTKTCAHFREEESLCERMPHSLWARGVSTLASLSSPGTEGEHAVSGVLCCYPMVPHTRNVIHSNRLYMDYSYIN